MLIIQAGEINYLTLAVDHRISGYTTYLVGEPSKYLGPRVKRQWVADAHIAVKFLYFFQWLIPVNAYQDQAFVFISLPDLLFKMRHFLAANAAPACSKLQDNNFSLQVLQRCLC